MRKTKVVEITADGRDKGKAFLLTEMPASQAEKWAARALLALIGAGVEVPDNIRELGMAAMAAVGLRALTSIQWHDAEPLLDEMMGCVRFMPNPKEPSVTSALVEDDIEEVATRVLLRSEVFGLHVGFSPAAEISKLRNSAAQTPSTSSPTQTSVEPSEQ